MVKEIKQNPESGKGKYSKKDIEDNKGMAIIAYIIFFLPLLFKTILFHYYIEFTITMFFKTISKNYVYYIVIRLLRILK